VGKRKKEEDGSGRRKEDYLYTRFSPDGDPFLSLMDEIPSIEIIAAARQIKPVTG
jgi:hypothetical protein